MNQLSPKMLLLILGSTLAVIASSQVDHTMVGSDIPIDHTDSQENASTISQSEPTCKCPPNVSEQLRASLEIECNSKLEVLNGKIHQIQNEIDHCQSHRITSEEYGRKLTEQTTHFTTECDLKLTGLRNDILDYQNTIDQCQSQHATYVVNTDKKIIDAEVQVDKCAAQTSILERKDEELRSEIALLRNSISIQMKQCNESISELNERLFISDEEINQCRSEKEKCRVDYDKGLQNYDQLQKEHVNLESLQEGCRQNMAECQSDYNEALRSKESIQKNHDHLMSLNDSKIKNMQEEQLKLSKEITRLKKSVKTQQDRYYDERDHATRLEKEMRIMRRNAETTYVNTTLVKRDIAWFCAFHLHRVYAIGDKEISKVRQLPVVEYAVAQLRILYGVAITSLQQLYSVLKEKYIIHCAPAVKTIKKTKFWKRYGAVGAEKIFQVRKSIFLTFASAVKQTATVGLDYTELTRENGDAKDSWIAKVTKRNLRYMKRNADTIANLFMIFFAIFMLAPALVGGVLRFFLRCILFLMLLPFRPFFMVSRCVL